MTLPEENVKYSAKILDVISTFGPWQRNFFILLILLDIVGTWCNLAVTFFAPYMDFWCTEAEFAENNFIVRQEISTEVSNETLFLSAGRCDVNVLYPNGTNFGNGSKAPCTKWEYNLTEYSKTIINEWDLVCDKEWQVSFAKSVFMMGFMLSVFVCGQLSDRIGRRPTILMCYFLTCIGGFLCALSTSYLMFIISRFIQAFGGSGLYTTGYVLFTEVISENHRTTLGIIAQIGFPFGCITLPAVAWFVREWYWLQLTLVLFIVPFCSFYWIALESPRWLLTQGKWEELEKVLDKVTKINGRNEIRKEMESTEILQPVINNETNVRRTNIFDLFRKKSIVKRLIIMSYVWIVNAFVFYGISYNTNDLWGNPYLNLMLTGVMQLPSLAATFYGVQYLGRKRTLIATLFTGAILYTACATVTVVPQNVPWLNTMLVLLGQLCISSSFSTIYLYTIELFPTVIRNSAFGTCSTVARIGSVFAPFVKELAKNTDPSVPYILYTIFTVLAGILVFLLPETKNQKISDTLEEDEYQEKCITVKRKMYTKIANNIGRKNESEEEELN